MKRPFDPAVRARCEAARQHPNVRAMFMAQRFGESFLDDRAWTLRWGGTGQPAKTFTDLTKHPRIYEPGPNGPSSAAGAFQITASTFDEFAPWIGVTQFFPEDQELLSAAIMLAEHALDDVLAGRFDQAVAKLGGRWASFPSSKSGQRTQKLAELREVFVRNGGTLADEQPAAPIEERDTSGIPPREEAEVSEGGSGVNWGSVASTAADVGATLLQFFNPIAGTIVQSFLPLAKQKIAQELGRHTDKATAQAVADSLGEAMIDRAKVVAKTDDATKAALHVATTPEAARAVEEQTLISLEQLQPVLNAVHAMRKDAWEAERLGRDAATERNARERWDMTPWLVWSGCGLVIVVCLALVAALLVQSFRGTIDAGLLGLAGPLLMAGVKAWQEMFAHRFDGSKTTESLADIAKVQQGGRP